MNFQFSDDQLTIKDVAEKIFRDLCDDETIRNISKEAVPVHRALWAQLAESGLLGAPLPGAYGGSELGLAEICLIVQAQGAAVAPVPLLETVVECAMPVARFGSDALKQRILPAVNSGELMLAAVRSYQGLRDKAPVMASQDGDTWLLNGDSGLVSYGPVAGGFLVCACLEQEGHWLGYVDAGTEGVNLTTQKSMSGEICGHIRFDNVKVPAGDVLASGKAAAEALEWQAQRTYTALAAQQVGILKEGLQRAAEYTSERKQFGRPLASFQAVAQQAADAYMAIEALQGVYWRALADIEENNPEAAMSARVAKFWTAEAGHIAGHVALHIHGGIGQDLDYPAHRFFIWAKQNENYLGGANRFSTELGDLVAQNPEAVIEQ
ncbi:MAG: acyl-CoA dehydrogenase family protein [Ketobacteraceae bacterium]|nr:acyl-CoA dehydrogenase family protein [Ketobacteraceae bacterium]